MRETRPVTIFCDIDGTLVKHGSPFVATQPNFRMELLPGTLEKLEEWDRKGYNIISININLNIFLFLINILEYKYIIDIIIATPNTECIKKNLGGITLKNIPWNKFGNTL